MTYILLNYYKRNCGTKNIVFKNNKIIYHLLTKGGPILAILLAVNILWIFNILRIAETPNIVRFITLAIWTVSFVLFFFCFNRTAKKQLNSLCPESLYNDKSNRLFWNSPAACLAVSKEEKRILESYMLEQHISKERLKFHRANMDKELESLKPKLISVPNICGAMFVALYSITLGHLIGLAETFDQIKIVIIIGLSIILVFGALGLFVKSLKDTILNSSVFSKDYQALLQCIEIVDEIIFEQNEQ